MAVYAYSDFLYLSGQKQIKLFSKFLLKIEREDDF